MLDSDEPTNFQCLRMFVVICGTLGIIASAFILYLAVQPFEREEEGQPDLPLFSPGTWSIGGTLLAVSCLLLGGLCILCGFFGCPGGDDFESNNSEELLDLQALLQSALINRQAHMNINNNNNENSDSQSEESEDDV